MNLSSGVIVGILVVLAGLAVWRNLRKGAPCSCGDDCGCCGRDCHCGGARPTVEKTLHIRKEI